MTENEIFLEFENELKNSFFINIKYTLWRAPRFKRFYKDIFGVFDVVAVLPPTGSVSYFFQITTLTNLSHRRKKIKAFYEKIGFEFKLAYIFAWDKKRNNFKIEKV